MKAALNKEKTEKIKGAVDKKQFKDILEAVFYFAAAFLLSRNFVLQYASPFAVSLITASRRKNYFYSAAGAALGYLIFCPESFARYAAAIVIVLLACIAADAAGARTEASLSMASAFLALLATGLVVDLKTGGGSADYALTLAESILSAGGSFFFFRMVNCDLRRLRFKALPVSDITCIVISASLLLMSLAQITVFEISPARIAALFLVLITIRFGSDKLGIMLALSVGFAFSLGSSETLYLVGAYGFSALLCSLFCCFGSIACAASFALCCALFSIASQGGYACFAEALIAGILLCLLPEKIKDKITSFFHGSENITPDGSLRMSLVMRLKFASGAMNYISENVNEVREKINGIYERKAEAKRSAQNEAEYLADEIINEKTNEIRMVAADQFFSIADMLSDLAEEFDEAEHFNTIIAGKIRRLLGEHGIYPKNISVIEDKYGRLRIEILTNGRETAFSNARLRNEISKASSRYLAGCSVTHFRDDTMVIFTEKPNFYTDIGFAQHSAEGRLCGDTVKTVNDGKGHSVLIISDGMGRGGRAALDGAMGAGLLSRLLSAGFGFDTALKIVNSALLVKSNDESLATLDCACIDLFTGRVDFYKAGAPASYIVKSGKVTKCELSSMPAGILRGIEFAKRTAVLSENDLIVLVSDGITDLGTDWLSAILTGFEDTPVSEIADTILREALNCTRDKRQDDMSVIVARLLRTE